MIGKILLSFFLAMPAVVAVLTSRDKRTPVVRAGLFWGGLVACGLAAVTVLPMLACKGDMLTGFAQCKGGAGITDTLNAARPLIRGAAMAYILLGIPAAIALNLIEALGTRTKG